MKRGSLEVRFPRRLVPHFVGLILGAAIPLAAHAQAQTQAQALVQIQARSEVTSETVTLEQAFISALGRSETIASQDQLILQAEERYKQATGSLLPSINAIGSFTTQDPNATFGYSSSAQQTTLRLNVTQPLFRGLREFAGLRLTKKQVQAQKESRRYAELLLYLDVAQNFYTIRSLETDLTNLSSEIKLYERRMADLRARLKIGRSRPTELLTTESAMLGLRAQARVVEGQILAAREVFAFLTGYPAEKPLMELPVNPAPSLPLEDYLTKIEERPDIRAETERLAAADENVRIAWGAHLPSLDFGGNYYLARTGVANTAAWDLQLLASLPLYVGGTIQSEVREAKSLRTQEDLALGRLRRAARQELGSLYATLQADLAQVAELVRAVQVSERNYAESTQDYKLGLVNNLDVLQALTAYQENHRALDRARYSARLDRTRLEAAIGQYWSGPSK